MSPMDHIKDQSSLNPASEPITFFPAISVDSMLTATTSIETHCDAGSNKKKLSTDLKCIKSEIKCLERAVDSAFEQTRDLNQTVSDLGNQCVVNNINNDAIREIFYDFKKEVLARLTKLEGHIEILELIVHAEMNWLRSCCITDKYLKTRFLDDEPQVLRISWLSGQGLHRNEGKYVVWLDNCQRSLTTV
ncbi:hypothetical protein BJ165DRAFT_1405727 [Panaeolus papilionaceus]|nr:hypothetical protein BJ165DRAFT_1405727 [Panaeolus papilionaceus]